MNNGFVFAFFLWGGVGGSGWRGVNSIWFAPRSQKWSWYLSVMHCFPVVQIKMKPNTDRKTQTCTPSLANYASSQASTHQGVSPSSPKHCHHSNSSPTTIMIYVQNQQRFRLGHFFCNYHKNSKEGGSAVSLVSLFAWCRILYQKQTIWCS